MWGRTIRYAEVTSTNDLARDHAVTGTSEGTAVFATTQHDGRGRHGKQWATAPGKGLCVSYILRPPASVAHSAWLTLGAGLAVAEAVRSCGEIDAKLKWPNDVRVGGKKLAGILTETYRDGNGPVAIVGVGLNVNQEAADFPADLADQATSLRLVSGQEWPPDELLRRLTGRLQAVYQQLVSDRGSGLRERWSELDETCGHAVLVEAGETAWHGRAMSVDENGALWVDDEAGEPRRLVAGEVTIRLDG